MYSKIHDKIRKRLQKFTRICFHIYRAAKDGKIDILKEAAKKEINTKDVDGMTPVLWASFEGNLDALRLLVGKGGDPDKSDQFGNTALHLASAKGHFSCVDFLAKFGANLFALDIDNHNPQQLAAINNREEILRYLDMAAANLETNDKKKANALKEKAKKHSEKRIKEFVKRQQKQEQQQQQQQETERTNMLKAMKQKFWTGSHGNLSKMKDSCSLQPQDTKFSALVGSGTIASGRGAAQRKIQALKQVRQANANANNEFKVADADNGTRSVRSIEGMQRDSEVLYVGTYDSGKRGKIADVFEYDSNSIDDDSRKDTRSRHGTLSRCLSQPDFVVSGAAGGINDIAEDMKMQRQSGLFDRPGLGSLAIPRSVSSVLSRIEINDSSSASSSSKNSKKNRQRSQLVISDSEEDSESNSSDENENDVTLSPLKRFLSAYSLEEHLELLEKHQIDLDTLILLTEEDLKYLNLPLGPYRRLYVAIQERKQALSSPGAIIDSRL